MHVSSSTVNGWFDRRFKYCGLGTKVVGVPSNEEGELLAENFVVKTPFFSRHSGKITMNDIFEYHKITM